MSGSFDFMTVLFLAAAVLIGYRLWTVLGRKTGNERRPVDPYARREMGPPAPAPLSDDKVVPLRPDSTDKGAVPTSQADAEARVKDFAPEGSPIVEGLVEIARNDPVFEPKHFVNGAKTAYEMIVTAFAAGNRKMLKQLLSREVFEGFASAITDREGRGETAETSFVGINKADIIGAELKNRTARITVKFVSQLITAIRNRAGDVIDGDPRQIREVTDIWTFAREVSSKDPNWRLIATQPLN